MSIKPTIFTYYGSDGLVYLSHHDNNHLAELDDLRVFVYEDLFWLNERAYHVLNFDEQMAIYDFLDVHDSLGATELLSVLVSSDTLKYMARLDAMRAAL